MEFVFDGINTALQGLSRAILTKGVWRETRGFKCLEFPEPVFITIKNPTARICTIKERKWSYILPYAESLWLALGYNNLDDLPGYYVKSIYDYSDDGHTWRGAYSPRLRAYTASNEQYNFSRVNSRHGTIDRTIDQYKFVERSFKRDPNTRQAVITIADPNKDCENEEGELIITKDIPCNRSYQIMKSVDGKLDFTAYLRSNDTIFGFSHVNLFNHTFMLEYWSAILGIPMGKYYHFANNLHVYENKLDMIQAIADASNYEDESYTYKKNFKSLKEFDHLILVLEKAELESRSSFVEIPEEFDDFFSDWLRIFITKNAQKKGWKPVSNYFVNPILNKFLVGE